MARALRLVDDDYNRKREPDDDGDDDANLRDRRKEFEDYASVKAREIDEARLSWRYYHADQWTPDQLTTLKKRGQPAITFDRTGRKIDSLVGTVRKLRTDCKCYPNTPKGEAGAEVATQVVRTICDASPFEDLETECCRDGSVQGIAFDTDRELLWTDNRNRVRLVDHWHLEGTIWKWCLHAGMVSLMQGDSPFYNERNLSISKFFAFANQIDIDGDHYGFIRRLRGPQDAMNQHRSKSIHIMNTRQLKIKDGAVDDVEVARREASRPDGTLVYHGDDKDLQIIQPEQEFLQQTQYYQDAKAEIDNFGPNQQLMMMGQNTSGRAYNMSQQAGLAELGPFLKNFRMWKLAQYRAAWCAAQRYWTAQRFLRITSDEGVAQFMQINGVELDPFGQPQLVNALGQIDVDIHIDEGPDTETVMGDVFDTLMALAQNNVPVPPQAIIEASYLPAQEKKKLNAMISQPDPMKVQATQLMMQDKQADIQKKAAEVGKTQSQTMLNVAKARNEGAPDAPPAPQSPLDIAERVANIRETEATALHKTASARKLDHQALMAPIELMAEHAQRAADRRHDDKHKTADREAKKKEVLRSFRPPL